MGKSQQQTLKEMQEFLSEKKMISVLAEISGVSTRTVYDTFAANNFDELKGKKLQVAQDAIELIQKIKNMPEAAADVLKT